MATIPQTVEEILKRGDHGHLITWPGMTAGDDGQPLEMIGSAKRSVQVTGVFAGGGKGNVQGSNDGTNYDILRDVHGNNLKFTASGIAQIGVLPRYLRPFIEGGNVSTDLTFSLLIRKESR